MPESVIVSENVKMEETILASGGSQMNKEDGHGSLSLGF